VLPLAASFDTLGWLTRDGELLDRVAGVMLPEPPTPRPTQLVLAEDLLGLAEPAVQDAIATAAAELAADAGIRLNRTALCLPGELDQWFTAFRTVQAAQAWAAHGSWITAHPGVLGPGIAQRFAAGAAVSSRGLADAHAMVSSARAQLVDRV